MRFRLQHGSAAQMIHTTIHQMNAPYDVNYDDFVSCGRWDAEAGAVDNSIQHEYRWYEIAGGPFNIDATVLTLVLDANGADGRVTADAVRLERGSCSEHPAY